MKIVEDNMNSLWENLGVKHLTREESIPVADWGGKRQKIEKTLVMTPEGQPLGINV